MFIKAITVVTIYAFYSALGWIISTFLIVSMQTFWTPTFVIFFHSLAVFLGHLQVSSYTVLPTIILGILLLDHRDQTYTVSNINTFFWTLFTPIYTHTPGLSYGSPGSWQGDSYRESSRRVLGLDGSAFDGTMPEDVEASQSEIFIQVCTTVVLHV